MLPSEELRQSIQETYNIDLNKYAWSEEFKQQVLSTKLDKVLESHADTLQDVYQMGFNIGHCGLTSRYICRQFKEATLFYGTASLLIGTPSSPNGEHAWTTINGYLIDSTLMICIPLSEATQLGYIPEKNIAHDSARMLSEYDLYDMEYRRLEQQNQTYKKTNQ
jgi:hypothetical protein